MKKMSILVITLFLFISVIPIPYILRKNLIKLKNINKDKVNKENNHVPRNLENDNYIILYYNKDCYYNYGFLNKYRNGIDFIIIENNKNKMKI